MAQIVKNLPAVPGTQVPSLGWEDPLRRKWQPTPVFLPGKSHGQRNLVGYSQGQGLRNLLAFFFIVLRWLLQPSRLGRKEVEGGRERVAH